MNKPGTRANGISYRDAGVDIDTGNALIERIKPSIKSTQRDGILGGIGGFGGLFELPGGYRKPVLVSGTDGVGTKLRLAMRLHRHNTIGIDLVAMCANDIIVTGAQPLYFLDYYATGTLNIETAGCVIKGIAEGCRQAQMALIGGETAEMPGMYNKGDYDLAGFAVGVVEKDHIIDGNHVAPGNALIGLASSGAHANGYSLIRKILQITNTPLDQALAGSSSSQPLGEALLTPTKIYVKSLQALRQKVSVHALAHITGGGIAENLPRVLPSGHKAIVDLGRWSRGSVFNWLQTQGNIDESEMLRTFNCGIGMIAVIPAGDVGQTLDILAQNGETAYHIGTIEQTQRASCAPFVSFENSSG